MLVGLMFVLLVQLVTPAVVGAQSTPVKAPEVKVPAAPAAAPAVAPAVKPPVVKPSAVKLPSVKPPAIKAPSPEVKGKLPAPKISALAVSQVGGPGAPVEFDLRILNGAPKTVTVRDGATGALLGTNRGYMECTVENDCPQEGVLYGPYDIAAHPPTMTQPADPRFWETVGWLFGELKDGQVLKVAINGRRSLVLKCVGETTSWGVSFVNCHLRP